MLQKNMTFKFSILQSIYFIIFCAIVAFSNSYLYWRGISVKNIGLSIAVSSGMSVITLPYIAKLIENYNKITVRIVLITSFILISIFLLLTYMLDIKYILYPYILVLMLVFNTQSLLYTYIFEYINKGIEINFGLSRGIGSMSFAIFSFILGYFGNKYGFKYLPIFVIILSVILVYIIQSIDKIEVRTNKKRSKESIIRKYPRLIIFLLGISFLIFSHSVLNSFLLQIVENVSGTNISVGICLFIAAMVELPMMGFFQKFVDKFGLKNILIFSAVMFSVKAFITYLSTNIVMLYISYFTQIGAFALYLPASIYYINKLMNEEERVLGQAYLIIFGTIGAIIGNYLIGSLIEIKGVSFSLLITTIFTIIGTILLIKGISDKKVKN